jgi:dipeptidyl aminopeptidase/acylaminoacyl peptidase
MHDRPHARLAWLATIAFLACSHLPGASRYDADFRGPGRLVLIFEPADPEAPRALVVQDEYGARELPITGARGARWLSANELLVSQETPSEEPYGLPRSQLLRVDVRSGRASAIAEPARYFDAEPDPRGERVAIGLELDDQGESDLLVLALGTPTLKPVAGRNQPLDRPRWSPDGRSLVVLQTLPDSRDEEVDSGLSFGGQEISWPRLFRVSSDLRGALAPLRDGDPGQALAAGGSLPLFWSANGIFARQRRGLVRCDPAGSGCTLVWAPGDRKRVVDARAAGGNHALALVRDHAVRSELDLPRELHRVELDSGRSELLFTTPADLYLADIDWVDAP